MQYVDIHGHYAWDIDDGIESKEDAKKALKMAYDEHMTTLVATPHIIPGRHSKQDVDMMRLRINELKVEGQKYGIKVCEGCELYLNQDTLYALEDGVFMTIAGTKYLLCEFDVRKQLSTSQIEVENILYEIALKGYIPIIAHVERYFKEKLDLDRIEEWIELGYVIQVNSTSLLGFHGKMCQKHAFALIDHGLVHVIASDTHRCYGHRVPNLNQVSQLLSKRYDLETVYILLQKNPKAVLHNEKVENIQVRRSLLKKIFGRLV